MGVDNIFWIYFFTVNVIGFLTIAYDKHKAKSNGWRIPEIRFFLIGLVMGALGIYIGMKAFRHKTQHKTFVIGMPVLLAINIITGYFLLCRIN